MEKIQKLVLLIIVIFIERELDDIVEVIFTPETSDLPGEFFIRNDSGLKFFSYPKIKFFPVN